MISQSLFEGEQVRFSALDPEKDAEVLSRWTNTPGFCARNLDGLFRQYKVSELKKKYKEKIKKADETMRSYYFALRENEGDRMVGLLRFGWILPTHQFARICLDFENTMVLKSIGMNVLERAMYYAFMEMSLYRLSLFIPSYNNDEIELYEKAGFLREVQRRDCAFYDGKLYDELEYAILRPEWKQRYLEVKND